MEKSLIENLLEDATRRSYQKVPIRWLQGDPCVPWSLSYYGNEIFLKLTNFSPLSNKSKVEGGKEHV